MEHNLRKAVGQNVRKYRAQLELSQEEVAELAGVHWTYISGVERGRYNVSLDSLEKLAKALQKKPYELLK